MPERQPLQPDGLVVPAAPYTPVVKSGDLVYTSGQVPFGSDGKLVSDDISEQVRQALRNVQACLAAAGCGLGDVLKVNAYLSELADFPAYNEVYREFFQAPYPARTTVQAGLLGFKVEIEAVARVPA